MPNPLLLASLLAVALSAPQVPAPSVLIRIRLEFSGNIPRTIVSGAITEAANIWAAYGVEIAIRDPSACAPVPGDVVALNVRVISRPSRVPLAPLGAIIFAPDGRPGPLISVFYEDVVRMAAGARSFGGSGPDWPWALRQQFIARILGRVVAHEIGHYVLRSPGHAPSGLMRAVQTASELGEMATMRYQLSANDARRLHQMLGDEKKGPAQGRP
jgi:hypothetical protein